MCTHSVKVENDLHIFKYKNVSYSEYILIAWILLLFFLPLMWLSVLEELFGGMELSEIFLCAKSFIQLCLTLCNPVVARQAPLSMGFSRQKYWSGLPFPPPGDPPDPGIKPLSLMSPVLAGRFFTTDRRGITFPQYPVL